jgi:prepilin-type processing-associated H-X9-DG protein
MNQFAYGVSLAAFEDPANIVMLGEVRAQYFRQYCNRPDSTCCGTVTTNGIQGPRQRHSETSNIAFMDGHVKALKPQLATQTYHYHTSYHLPGTNTANGDL